MSLANFGFLLYEIYLSQQISAGGYYTLINRSKLGYEIPKKGKKDDGNSKQIELETLKAEKRERAINFQRFNKHKSFSSIGSLLFISILFTTIFALTSMLSFELSDCKVNTYDDGDNVCADCLRNLGIECKSCTSANKCDECKEGYMPFTTELNNTICKKCQLFHGPQCDRCNKRACENCIGNYFLNDTGVCEDCLNQKGCLRCNDTGCQECDKEKGYYLYKAEGQKPKCRRCDETLNNCAECKNESTCSLCS